MHSYLKYSHNIRKQYTVVLYKTKKKNLKFVGAGNNTRLAPIIPGTFWSPGRTNVQLRSLYWEKWFDIQGFRNFTTAHFVAKCHAV